MKQLVVIHFARPRNTQSAPAINQDAMRADLHRQLEVILKARLGNEVALRLELGATSDIRLEGRFQLKPNEVKGIVSEALGEVMESFDPSGYTF
jgi:hypothetical protein